MIEKCQEWLSVGKKIQKKAIWDFASCFFCVILLWTMKMGENGVVFPIKIC